MLEFWAEYVSGWKREMEYFRQFSWCRNLIRPFFDDTWSTPRENGHLRYIHFCLEAQISYFLLADLMSKKQCFWSVWLYCNFLTGKRKVSKSADIILTKLGSTRTRTDPCVKRGRKSWPSNQLLCIPSRNREIFSLEVNIRQMITLFASPEKIC